MWKLQADMSPQERAWHLRRNPFFWLALIGLVWVGDRVGGWLCEQLVAKSAFRYSRLYYQTAPADVLFLGNSRGLMFYQPEVERQTGLQTFNLSYNALPIDLGRVLAVDWMDRTEVQGRLLVIDVTMCDRTNDGLIAACNAYRKKSSRLDSLIRVRVPKAWWGGVVSHLFRYNSEIFQRALYYLERSDESWLLDRVITERMKKANEVAPPYTIRTNAYLLEQLAHLVSEAQRRGMEVRLLINPYWPPFAARMRGLDTLQRQVSEATGLPVLDYSTALSGDALFGDYQHVNKRGAALFIQKLVADGVLPVRAAAAPPLEATPEF